MSYDDEKRPQSEDVQSQDELSDDDLDNVAGGTTGDWNGDSGWNGDSDWDGDTSNDSDWGG